MRGSYRGRGVVDGSFLGSMLFWCGRGAWRVRASIGVGWESSN